MFVLRFLWVFSNLWWLACALHAMELLKVFFLFFNLTFRSFAVVLHSVINELMYTYVEGEAWPQCSSVCCNSSNSCMFILMYEAFYGFLPLIYLFGAVRRHACVLCLEERCETVVSSRRNGGLILVVATWCCAAGCSPCMHTAVGMHACSADVYVYVRMQHM